MSMMKLDILRGACATVLAVSSMLMLLMSVTLPAEARGGGHGLHHGSGEHGMHNGGSFANGRRHGNDAYVKGASGEEEKLLERQIKSICRDC